MINSDYLIKKIGNLSKDDFFSFCRELLKCSYAESLEEINEQDSFFAMVPSGFISPLALAEIFIVEYLPYELFSNPYTIPFDNPVLRKRIQAIWENFNNSPVLYRHTPYRAVYGNPIGGVFFFNHIVGTDREFFTEIAYEQYQKMMDSMGIGLSPVGDSITLGVGSPYSYIGNAPKDALRALKSIETHNSHISIEFSMSGYEVNSQQYAKYVTSGVGKFSGEIYYPCIVKRKTDTVCKEFEQLLNSNASEKQISSFIYEHYRIILGNQYDSIKSEVCLGFPELDIAEKNRRVDLMVHNRLENDWEIIELKKKIPLIRNYRDMSAFSSEVTGAIYQLKNYYELLLQERVRESLKRDGIDYCYPRLKLIVGGSINTSHKQWMYLLSDVRSTNGIEILTYEKLIQEMKMRFFD